MDSRRFDEISRRLAGATTRRSALATLAAVGLGLGGIGLGGRDADAKRKRKKRCKPACAAGQSCVKGACRCDDGGTTCGTACCRIGQECRDGQCVELPEPTTCIAYGEACKNAGAPCCENLQCGSGQGGAPVACWVRKTGRCTSTAECIYGTECKEGICVGLPQPQPGPTCVVEECPDCAAPKFTSVVGKACEGGACACTCKVGTITGTLNTNFTDVQCQGVGGCGAGQQCADVTQTPPTPQDFFFVCTPTSKFCCCATIENG